MSYLVISNTNLCFRGVLNDFNKIIFETQKQEEAHGNTKNKRKQKRRFCCEKNQFCFVVLLFTISIENSVTIALTSHRIKIKIHAFFILCKG